jgi:LPS export ABC transporter permease LptG
MRILDRYAVKQLLPVWIWCLAVFVFLSVLIDLFEHLDEILRYHIPWEEVAQYYLNFMPIVFVRASPLALLLATAFVATRLTRYQEFLAMNASGTSLLRASVPFLYVGWLATLCVFLVNEQVVPRTSVVYERLRLETFRGRGPDAPVENVAIMDSMNRLYHARELDLKANELRNLTVLEHDWHNRPTKSVYASRAVSTPHGWLLLYGTIYRVGPRGTVEGEPEPFVERLIAYPVSVQSFAQPEARPESMRFSQLRLMITRMRQMGLKNVRRYMVELYGKLTLPLMNLVIGFIAFAGSTQPQLRGHLKGLGTSLLWGIAYYFGVGVGHSFAKQGMLFLPAIIWVWAPHAIAVWWCVRTLRRAP